jgi:hypothetical protein
MGHVRFRGWQLHAAVVLVIACVFAALAATAEAMVTSISGSGGAACSNTPNAHCTFAGSGSVSFAGEFTTVATNPDPMLCSSQQIDPIDLLCDHVGLNFSNLSGTLTATLNFDPDNDLDLCIVDAAGQVVTDVNGQPACSLGTGASETVTIPISCSTTALTAQILPASFGVTGPPFNPATYTGSVTATLTVCPPGGGQGNPPPPSASGGHKMTGGGQISTANVSNTVIQQTDGVSYKGKVRFTRNGCDLRSTSIDSAEWDDANRAVVVHGHATVNGSGNVLFTVRLDDNGEPGNNDLYNMQAACSGAGNMTSGNLQYHLP